MQRCCCGEVCGIGVVCVCAGKQNAHPRIAGSRKANIGKVSSFMGMYFLFILLFTLFTVYKESTSNSLTELAL